MNIILFVNVLAAAAASFGTTVRQVSLQRTAICFFFFASTPRTHADSVARCTPLMQGM